MQVSSWHGGRWSEPAKPPGRVYALAAVLALLGVVGVVNLSVSGRTGEIGVRMALGARRAQVVGRVLGTGVGLVLAGVALGLLLALPASRAIGDLLFEVRPTDPRFYLAAAITLAVVAGVASYLPARRAANVDPARALSSE